MSGRPTAGQLGLALAIAAFLLAFLIVPVGTVIHVAFTEKGTGAFTLVNFADFLRTDLFVRAFWNSVYVSGMAVLWASAIALPPSVSRPLSAKLRGRNDWHAVCYPVRR